MKITKRTDEELNNCWPKGTYHFKVEKAEDAISKKGDEMIKLKLTVNSRSHGSKTMFAYLIDTFPRPLKHFCVATGMLDKYESGMLEAHHCEGKSGLLKLVIEYRDGYDPANKVDDYVTAEKEEEEELGNNGEPVLRTELNDDIPF